MEPNKFEKEIKKMFDGREIRPSASAWDRIEKELEGEPPAQKDQKNRWYAIVAGIIVLLGLSIGYFSQKSDGQEPMDTIISVEIEEPPAPKVEEGIDTDIEMETPMNGLDVNDALVVTQPKEQESTARAIDKNKPTPGKSEMVSEDLDIASVSSDVDGKLDSVPQNAIDRKIGELVAQVGALEALDTEITDAEIDSLLRLAQRQILAERALHKKGTVDAMALLAEVEDELDRSYRDQLFEKLKEGFFKVRTAVVDRNR
ncbi:MAG: hypothetical protein AB3N16_02225 [Flavobacteriaceae bacterium]